MTAGETVQDSAREESFREEVAALVEDITIAVADGVFSLEGQADAHPNPPSDRDPAKVSAFIARHGVAVIKGWHERVQEAYNEQIEQEDEQILRDQVMDSGYIDPSDPLYDPMRDLKRRKRIEKGLKPLDFEEMVFKGYTRQEIVLREGFSITLRTIPTQHGLWLEWMMAKTEESSVHHTRHLFSLMQLAASLDFINTSKSGPDVTRYYKDDDASREAFEGAIKERMEMIGRLPSALSDDLIIQFVWFNGRVRRLLAGDLLTKVGNY